jgi:hypothetical protein
MSSRLIWAIYQDLASKQMIPPPKKGKTKTKNPGIWHILYLAGP